MATYFARATGNINGSIWSTTPTGTASTATFTSSDVLISNSFTVTINVNTTAQEIRNDTTGGATAGGGFNLSSGVTLTANVIGGNVNSFLLQIPTGTSSLVGNITGAASSFPAVNCGNSGTNFSFTGSITGGSGSSSALAIAAGGTYTVTGNVSGGPVGAAFAGVQNNSSAATVTIVGTITGGTATGTGYGAANTSSGTLIINGTAIGGSVGIGAANTSTGTMTVTRAKGNGFGNGSTGLSSAVGVAGSQTGLTQVSEIEYGDLGQSPTSGPVFINPSTTNVSLFYRVGLGKKTLISADSVLNVFPSASDVRKGVSFNAGNSVGTMAVPPAASVASGVAVDNTIGTAFLNASDVASVWNVAVSGIGVSGSIGERLKNCSTVATMGQQLATSLTNVS